MVKDVTGSNRERLDKLAGALRLAAEGAREEHEGGVMLPGAEPGAGLGLRGDDHLPDASTDAPARPVRRREPYVEAMPSPCADPEAGLGLRGDDDGRR